MKPSNPAENYIIKEGVCNFSGAALAELAQEGVGGGYAFRFTAGGYSMAPFVKDGDIISISPLPRLIRSGMIIAYKDPHHSRLVVHRVVSVKKEGVVTKGDNLKEDDGFIPKENCIGVVNSVKRSNKKVYLGLLIGPSLVALLSRSGFLPLGYRFARKIYQIIKG